MRLPVGWLDSSLKYNSMPGKPGSGKGIRWVSALRWKSASMIRMASRAHCRLSLMAVVLVESGRSAFTGSAPKLRKKPTAPTDTAELQSLGQLLGSPARGADALQSYITKKNITFVLTTNGTG
ncbi:hypothetical protein EMIT0P2_30411 [Pseudomonas sp. IT-P2]